MELLQGLPQLLERHERLMGTRSVLEAGGGRDLLSRWSQAENIDGPTLIPRKALQGLLPPPRARPDSEVVVEEEPFMGWSFTGFPQLLERHERLMGTRSVLEAGGP